MLFVGSTLYCELTDPLVSQVLTEVICCLTAPRTARAISVFVKSRNALRNTWQVTPRKYELKSFQTSIIPTKTGMWWHEDYHISLAGGTYYCRRYASSCMSYIQ